ncbi:MAG: ABC transporter substrate-binding protein, partial [Acetatifactor sp.]
VEGNFKWETPIENLQTEDYYYYIQNMIPAKDGKVVLLINGEESSKMTVDSEGNVSERTPIKVSGGNSSGNMEMTMVKDDGTLLFTYYDDNYTNMYIATYDITTDTMGEGIKMPDAFYNMGYSSVTAGVDSDIVFANSSGVFSYTMGDTEVKPVMSYINSDMSIDSLNQIVMLDDTHFIATYYDPFDYKQQCGLFTKVNAEDIPDKNVLVLGGSYIDTDLKKRVVDFNKSNEKYRITLKEYQMYNTREDYMAGYTQLNNDILAGNMPDILVVDEWGMSVENYVSKGVLADIGALIEKDEELSQKEFMTNVFDAYKVNGKLYQVIPSFYVQTMMGKKSLVGDRTSWTMKDMEEVLAKLPEETQVFGETTKSSFLYNMLEFCGNDYVDVATGKCNFDSQQFIDMLEYANTLPQELSEDYYGDDWWMKYQSQYRENRTLLMYSYIGDFSNLNNQINGYFGEDVSCIGFPTDNGMGSFVGTNGSYVLSAKSKNLEGAWEFIRYYLTDEYQNSMQWGLPVSKTAFMEKSKDATGKDYYIDENGVKSKKSYVMYV